MTATAGFEQEEHDDDAVDLDDAEDLEPDALAHTVKDGESQRLTPDDDRPAVGSWWWFDSKSDSDAYKPADYDEPGKKWIACVTEVGSNYAKVKGVRFSSRIGLDNFYKLCKPEANPAAYIANKVGFHKKQVRELMGEIQQICHRLGVPLRQALTEAETDKAPSSQALAVRSGEERARMGCARNPQR